jgi:hypothetical protein
MRTKLYLAISLGIALLACSSNSNDDGGTSSSAKAPSSSSKPECIPPFAWNGQTCAACPSGYEAYQGVCARICNASQCLRRKDNSTCETIPNCCPTGTQKGWQSVTCGYMSASKAWVCQMNSTLSKQECLPVELQSCVKEACNTSKYLNTSNGQVAPSSVINACSLNKYGVGTGGSSSCN